MGLDLDRYFARIGYSGPAEPTAETLRAVHRAQGLSVAYENIDVVLERPVDQDIERIYDKIVVRGRGGWCYELNGLLGWALGEIGFAVTRMCGGVMRVLRGDDMIGNHLVLGVDLGGPWIADVGLGDGMLEPAQLQEGGFRQSGRAFRFESLGAGEWRFHNRDGAIPPSFDFVHAAADEDRLAAVCDHLQTDPESMFRQNLVCQIMTEDGAKVLLGRVLSNTGGHPGRRLLASEDELLDVLENTLRIAPPDITGLWDKVVARHETLFGDTPVDDIRFGPPS